MRLYLDFFGGVLYTIARAKACYGGGYFKKVLQCLTLYLFYGIVKLHQE